MNDRTKPPKKHANEGNSARKEDKNKQDQRREGLNDPIAAVAIVTTVNSVASSGSFLGMRRYFEQDGEKLIRPGMLELISIEVAMILTNVLSLSRQGSWVLNHEFPVGLL